VWGSSAALLDRAERRRRETHLVVRSPALDDAGARRVGGSACTRKAGEAGGLCAVLSIEQGAWYSSCGGADDGSEGCPRHLAAPSFLGCSPAPRPRSASCSLLCLAVLYGSVSTASAPPTDRPSRRDPSLFPFSPRPSRPQGDSPCSPQTAVQQGSHKLSQPDEPTSPPVRLDLVLASRSTSPSPPARPHPRLGAQPRLLALALARISRWAFASLLERCKGSIHICSSLTARRSASQASRATAAAPARPLTGRELPPPRPTASSSAPCARRPQPRPEDGRRARTGCCCCTR